jgi:hypothetical protein
MKICNTRKRLSRGSKALSSHHTRGGAADAGAARPTLAWIARYVNARPWELSDGVARDQRAL